MPVINVVSSVFVERYSYVGVCCTEGNQNWHPIASYHAACSIPFFLCTCLTCFVLYLIDSLPFSVNNNNKVADLYCICHVLSCWAVVDFYSLVEKRRWCIVYLKFTQAAFDIIGHGRQILFYWLDILVSFPNDGIIKVHFYSC
jgi:hypothetical protein